jgi:hypothetical protein
MDLSDSDSARPVFSYSIRRGVVWWAAVAPIVTLFCFYAILFESVGVVVDTFLLLVGLTPEFELFRHWAWSIWTARFYSDHAEIRARKISKSFVYSDVLTVVLRRSALGATLLLISLSGEQKTVALQTNPVNKRLGMNLNDWLRVKAQLDSTSTLVEG